MDFACLTRANGSIYKNSCLEFGALSLKHEQGKEGQGEIISKWHSSVPEGLEYLGESLF